MLTTNHLHTSPHRSLVLVFLLLSYFSQAGEWKKKADIIAGNRQGAVSFSANGKGYVGMGSDEVEFKKDFWQYDPVANKWWQKASLPGDARISAFAFSLNGKGYVGTGQTGTQNARHGLSDMWEYDTETNRWTKLNDFPGGARYGAVSFCINGKAYVALGSDGSQFLSDLWEYDQANDKWTKRAAFPGSPRMDAAAFVVNGQGYVMLGQKNKLFVKEKDCYRYDPQKDQWKKMSDFPGNPRVGSVAFSMEDKGYVYGGGNGLTQHNQDLWELDAATDKWTKLPDAACGAKDYAFCFVINTSAYIGSGRIPKNLAITSDLWEYYVKPSKQYFEKLNAAFGGSLFLGDEHMPLAGAKIKLSSSTDVNGRELTANMFGSFLFHAVTPAETYYLSMEITDPAWKKQKIYIYSRTNELIGVLDSTNQFKLQVNSKDQDKIRLLKVESKNLRMDLNGKLVLDDNAKTPLKNIPVSLTNRDNQIIQMSKTDETGKYAFTYLPLDTGMYISLNEKDISFLPKESSILMLDVDENVVASSKVSKPVFNFDYLKPDERSLAKIYIEDAWVQVSYLGKNGKTIPDTMRVIENIYFNVGRSDIGGNAKTVLDKVVLVMKSNPDLSIEIEAHTDSRGDNSSNLSLSDKRARSARDYLVDKGLNSKRISAKGFGETKLLNKCADGVECTEEEHAKNRRMEFKFKLK